MMLTAADFEQRYRSDPDPWHYTSSEYEARKYAATLKACGAGPFTRALELGGSIGVFSALLAPRCKELVTVDCSPTAVAMARGRLADLTNVRLCTGLIPRAIPGGRYDLVVASEVLYYLTPGALTGTLARLCAATAQGTRLVCVHWRCPGPERPFDATEVHARICAQPWLERVASGHTPQYLLDVLVAR